MELTPKAAAFDLDGTLLWTMDVWSGVGERYLVEQGVPVPGDLDRRLTAMSLEQSAAWFSRELGVPYPPEEVLRQIDEIVARRYRAAVRERGRSVILPGAEAYLQCLAEAGVPCCVATAVERATAEAVLDELGLHSYFAFVHSCTEAGCNKEVPDFYASAVARLGAVPEETWVFEDAPHALAAARAAGCHTVAVTGSAGVDRVADRAIVDYRELL
ncbi:HAD family hydrolase [Bittarella massiliensis (ex Durand et al. 2017)]|uniref:HAD family hydrolase n=1 Tax=Bittarella massiliensis (ex Durand et al. 2017) TaxID=1720313 RepID=UPI001AA13919|nr:HAD-IA family hydrolase [Bittarella massiliensis (ex Durand et al. 2017)]